MQLQEKYPDQLQTITLNLDYDQTGQGPSNDLQQEIVEKLDSLGINTENLICSTQTHQALDALQIATLPSAIVYHADGKLAKKFDGDLDFRSKVKPFVESLLSQPNTP
ncbi:MAG: hypothetical protein P8N76_06770 [Pirellulaceae bacterium]|nr:hypothetical protein [Pirellulaceae bacterium]